MLIINSLVYTLNGTKLLCYTKCTYPHFTYRKTKRLKCSFKSTFQVILAGDVKLNPRPDLRPGASICTTTSSKRKTAPKCTSRNKGVGANRKRLCCTCLSLTHVSCSTLHLREQTAKRWPFPNYGFVRIVLFLNYLSPAKEHLTIL